MISLLFSGSRVKIVDINYEFDLLYDRSWLLNPIVKEILGEHEYLKVNSSRGTVTRLGGNEMSMPLISYEAKALLLICCANITDSYFKLNTDLLFVSKYITKMSLDGKVNARLYLNNPTYYFVSDKMNFICENDGSLISTNEDFRKKKLEFIDGIKLAE